MLRKILTTLLVITVVCCLVMTGCSAKNSEEAYKSRLANVEPPQNTETFDMLKSKVDTLLEKEEIEHEDFFLAAGSLAGDSYIEVVMLTAEEVKVYPITSSKRGIIDTIVFDSKFNADKDFIRTHQELVNPDDNFISSSLSLTSNDVVKIMELKLEDDQFVLE